MNLLIADNSDILQFFMIPVKNPIKITNPLISLAAPASFPDFWTHLLDKTIPTFVKTRFSPKETWKDKPFTKEDRIFFSKGLLELSDYFTIDRSGAKLPAYFTTPKFRSSYFLYFFALQGGKFLSLFEKYERAIQAMLDHAHQTGELRIVDIGSGPGTASFALLTHVLTRYQHKKKLPFRVRMIWIDRTESILKDGEILLAHWLEHLSTEWDGDIELDYEVRDWWKHPSNFNTQASLILFGNVLNESPNDPRVFSQGLAPLLKDPTGGGILFIEPAFKTAAQRLSQIRDEWLDDPTSPRSIWGPCLHLGRCPLSHGRDWCHFSIPAKMPGKWFRNFSIDLGGIREWLKFSFIWLAARQTAPAPIDPPEWFRVVSDPMKTDRGRENQICRPDRIGFVPTPAEHPIFRGDLIQGASHDSVLRSKNPIHPKRKSVRRGGR
jgi:hypothetical protein